MGIKGHPWRALDQLKILKLNPINIVELGSGSSTGIFAKYVNENQDRSLLSVDESEVWASLTKKALTKFGASFNNKVQIKVSKKVEDKDGSSYEMELPDQIDLLYIDGPTLKREGRKKFPNLDIIKLFRKNVFPKIIMIDGRIDTVNLILSSTQRKKYKYIANSLLMLKYKMHKTQIIHFGKYHRHSIFILK